MVEKVRLTGQFENWIVDVHDGIIWDEGNNPYKIGEIRAIFYYRQLARNFESSPAEIRSLKQRLEKKITDAKTPPKVIIDWGEIKEKLIHPHYR